MDPFEFKFDVYKKKLITNCDLRPTELEQSDTEWLYASNNKYADESIDDKKIGKWMLFVSKNNVNVIWNKIKTAIAEGGLWHSKISTSRSGEPTYAIMIYTKDYTDLNDVIYVLDYLESSGIKPPNLTIKYKTDEQTRSGIYRGNSQKPWIYSSDRIRMAAIPQRSDTPFWRENQPSSSAAGSSVSESRQSYFPN